jgi:hypothetical protein
MAVVERRRSGVYNTGFGGSSDKQTEELPISVFAP